MLSVSFETAVMYVFVAELKVELNPGAGLKLPSLPSTLQTKQHKILSTIHKGCCSLYDTSDSPNNWGFKNLHVAVFKQRIS